MSVHIPHYEPWTSEEIAALVKDHERIAPKTKQALWHTHFRKTPDCTHEAWVARPGSTMYDHITAHLRMMTGLQLNSTRMATRLEDATVSLEQARHSLATLFAYETLVRTHPQAALLELRKGELGQIGHVDVFAHLTGKSGSTMREYVNLIHARY